MNQHATLEQIIDYLHDELVPADDARIHQHLETCAQCRALYDEQSQLSEALVAYKHASERELPQGVIARIWDAVEQEHARPSLWESLAGVLRWPVLAPAAVVAALVLFFGARALTPTANSIDVAYYLQDHAALTNTVPFHEGSVEPATLQNDVTATDQHWVATTGASIVTAER
jgi:predicted anti-sigma-YlaC factor YlaD